MILAVVSTINFDTRFNKEDHHRHLSRQAPEHDLCGERAGMTCEVLFDKAKVILGSRASRLTKSQVSAWMRFVEILERFRENLTRSECFSALQGDQTEWPPTP